ncbi:hypothetical protein [Bosea sp. PAMC 26642]|uniref:hypothetical protein n=1 Tax=Bosea sp. (strain PAMC 26642) TaxID=1792307 RepID=UPI0007706372|nr:hypothetical protein [Bosea sp. PAMC 26642]AMJ62636.1 hypothetical protein AXW83_22150 [Bosea sp. PAMC 26642]
MQSPSPLDLPRRAAKLVLQGVLTAAVLLDEIARPLYRPLARWLAGLRIVARIEAWIAGLPRLVILILLAAHFAVVEPLKIVGLFLMGRGQVAAGVSILALAYLASFVIVERIYHAGRAKLLTYGWLAWAITLLTSIRVRIFAWVRSSAAYQAVARLRDEVRRRWRRLSRP